MDQVKEKFDNANKVLSKIGLVNNLSKQTGLPPIAFAIAPILVLIIAVALDIFASGCTTLVGVVYPVIRSIIALETKEKDDDT